MVSLRDVENIVNASRLRGFRVTFRFKGIRYEVVIDGEVKAIDPEGVKVPWGKAFQQPPHVVLSTYRVDRITVECGGSTVATFSSLQEFLKSMDSINCR